MGGRAFADARGQASLYPGYAGDAAMGQAIIGGDWTAPLLESCLRASAIAALAGRIEFDRYSGIANATNS